MSDNAPPDLSPGSTPPRPIPEQTFANAAVADRDFVGVYDVSGSFDAVGHDTPVAVEHDGNVTVGPKNHWLSGQQNPGGSTIADEATFNASPKKRPR